MNEEEQNTAKLVKKTAAELEKQKRNKEKTKVNNEINRWAYGYQYEADANYDSDISIDDSYLDEIGGTYKTKEELNEAREKKRIKMKEQKAEVNTLLQNIRMRNLVKSASFQARNNFLRNINGEAGDNQPDLSLYLPVRASVSDSSDEDQSDNEKLSSRGKKEHKSVKPMNKMSRAVPGIIQQNITLERVFYKDLLKLSRQRYITKLNLEFQQKRFTAKQTRKGFIEPPGRNSRNSQLQTPESRNMSAAQRDLSSSMGSRNYRYKSASAFGVRAPLPESATPSSNPRPAIKSASSKKLADKEAEEVETKSGAALREPSSKEVNFKEDNQVSASRSRPHTSKKDEQLLSSNVHKDKERAVSSLKSTLKRPHTSFAVMKKSSELDHFNDNTFDLSSRPTTSQQQQNQQDPVKDDRYLSLLNSMNAMYSTVNELNHKDPNKRVDTLIRKNKALYGRIEMEKEKVKNYKLDAKNLQLFEKLMAGVW